jgi:myosin heavy subunit
MSVEELVLPFAAAEKVLSDEVELASVICIARSRARAGPFRRPMKHLEFVSKLAYPVWATPWGEKCFLIDGLKGITGSFVYPQGPDPENFIEDLKRNSKNQDHYLKMLKNQLTYFSRFSSRREVPFAGLMDNKELLSDIINFMLESKTEVATLHLHSIPGLSMRISSNDATALGNLILQYYNRLHSNVKGLRFAEETLETQTQRQIEKSQKEDIQIQQDFTQEIESLKREIAEKNSRNEYDAKLQELTIAVDRKMNVISKDKKKLENELLKLGQERAELEKRKKLRKEKKDKIGEVRWKVRLENVEHKISEAKRKINPITRQIREITEETKRSKKKLQNSYQELAKKEDDRVSDLENLHNKKTDKKAKNATNLQRNTQNMVENIENIISEINMALSRIEETTVGWKAETPFLIALPFYAISLRSQEEKNISLLPPVVIQQNKGLAMRIRWALGTSGVESRISSFFKPRSRNIETFLLSFEKKLENDNKLRSDLEEIGFARNLITRPDFKEKLKNGLERLEAEEWISPGEKETVLNEFATH